MILEPDKLATSLADFGVLNGYSTLDELKWCIKCTCSAALIMTDNYVRTVNVAGKPVTADQLLDIADAMQKEADELELAELCDSANAKNNYELEA